MSKDATCSRRSPNPLGGHLGMCSDSGQGKQILGLGQGMDSDSTATGRPGLTWLPDNSKSVFLINPAKPGPQPHSPASLQSGSHLADHLSFRKLRDRAWAWPLGAQVTAASRQCSPYPENPLFLAPSRLPLSPLPGALPQRSGGSLSPPLQVGSNFTSSRSLHRATCPDPPLHTPPLHTPPFTLPHLVSP